MTAEEFAAEPRDLIGRHLLAVEVAGVLLLVALIGAIAVVTRGEAALEADRRADLGRAVR